MGEGDFSECFVTNCRAESTEKNAEAVVNMAVMRKGVESEFFSEVPAGKYKEGDTWKGNGL